VVVLECGAVLLCTEGWCLDGLPVQLVVWDSLGAEGGEHNVEALQEGLAMARDMGCHVILANVISSGSGRILGKGCG
jgi:hypothetical protein